MIPIPAILRKNGFTYTQVLHGLRSCLYAQKVDENLIFYEVFLIRTKPEQKIFNNLIPEREVFPPDEAFGTWAWSFRDYEKAVEKYNELENGK